MEDLVRAGRDDVLLGEHLDGVGEGMEQPHQPEAEDAGAVGPDPVLDDGRLLALDPGVQPRQVQDAEEHDRRQHQLDGHVSIMAPPSLLPAWAAVQLSALSVQSFRSSSPRTAPAPSPAPGRSPGDCARPVGDSAAGPFPGACSSPRGSPPAAERRDRCAGLDRGSSRRSRPFPRTLRSAAPSGPTRPSGSRWSPRRRRDASFRDSSWSFSSSTSFVRSCPKTHNASMRP